MSVTNKALFVIERNLHRDLTLDQIAKYCDVSRFHLTHAFGESTGLPVMEYLRGRRLTEAAYALRWIRIYAPPLAFCRSAP
jgi:AraC family transcriptional regulator